MALLMLGGGLRLWSAATGMFVWIERQEFVPAALTISWDHLPIRVAQHGALPIYFIRGGTLLFGRSVFEMRIVSAIAGTATILLIYLIAARWWGRGVGLTAAALLTVERYHIGVSGRAIDLPFDLFFVALAMFSFSRFLATLDRQDRSVGQYRWLYLLGASIAFGFLCKELSGIMLPVVFLTFVFLQRMDWLLRRETWFAVGVFALIVAPDLCASLTVTQADRLELWDRQKRSTLELSAALNRPDMRTELEESADSPTGLFMSYGDQLSRFRSIGFNSEPFYFYFGSILDALGVEHLNSFTEFPFLHPMMGVLLWLGVLAALVHSPKDNMAVFCVTMFFVAFIPFAMVQLRAPREDLATDPVMLWYWVDRTMLPAMLLAANGLGRAYNRSRRAVSRPLPTVDRDAATAASGRSLTTSGQSGTVRAESR